MPDYRYVAVNDMGKTVKGTLKAANELDLEDRLKRYNLELIKASTSRSLLPKLKGKLKTKDLIMLCISMEQLDRAGVPLLDALADLRDTGHSAAFRDLMSEIHENVKGGDMLSEALEARSDIFSEVFTGLIGAGEKTGNMANAFMHLADHLKWQAEMNRKVKKALKYPIALLVLMSGVIAIMMTAVVPQLTEFLDGQGFDLPWYTELLIKTSDAFVEFWYLIFGLPVLTIILIVVLYKVSTSIRYFIDAILLRTPVMGGVILKSNLARFCRFFGICYTSGIGVLECLNITHKVMSNAVLQDSVMQISQNVAEGNTVSHSIEMTGRFPSLVLRMFKVGEESGNMDRALQNVNFFYDREVSDSVDALVGMIQPTLTLVMGLMMFWIIAAIFGPLYSTFSEMEF